MSPTNLHRVVMMLNSVGKTYFSKSKGMYPLNLNTCIHQSDKELINEINRFIIYVKGSNYKYLVRDKS